MRLESWVEKVGKLLFFDCMHKQWHFGVVTWIIECRHFEYMAHKGWRPNAINTYEIVFKIFQRNYQRQNRAGEKAIRDGMTSSLNSILDNAAKRCIYSLKAFEWHETLTFFAWKIILLRMIFEERKTAHSFSIVVFLLFLPRLASHTMEMELLYNVKNVFVYMEKKY
jgi:hypothetical protein